MSRSLNFNLFYTELVIFTIPYSLYLELTHITTEGNMCICLYIYVRKKFLSNEFIIISNTVVTAAEQI